MILNVKSDYEYGDIVYIKTDPNQYPRQVVCLLFNPTGIVQYGVQSCTYISYHYGFELTIEKDVVLASS